MLLKSPQVLSGLSPRTSLYIDVMPLESEAVGAVMVRAAGNAFPISGSYSEYTLLLRARGPGPLHRVERLTAFAVYDCCRPLLHIYIYDYVKDAYRLYAVGSDS